MIATLIQDTKNYIDNPAPSAPIDAFGQLEKLASTFGHVDGLFYFTYAVCIFFFVLITGVLGWSVFKYRRKTYDQPAASNVTHNTPLEVVWTVVPLIIVMVMFAWGWKGSLDMTVVPADARQYKAIAQQWSWTFMHPNSPIPGYGDVYVELGKPAAFTLESVDVLHAFFVPSMRVKRDVIPGRLQTVWFQPMQLGTYHLFCAEYCGENHSKMYARVHVVSAETMKTTPWDIFDPLHPEKSGENLYKANCLSCHSINGTRRVGPTWKGLWGKMEDVIEGGVRKQVKVDEVYIIESVRKPDAKKVVGFENASPMSPFPESKIDKDRLDSIIAYMKTLADKPAGNDEKK